MRTARKAPRDPWFQVRRDTRCAYGCEIARRAWARFGLWGQRYGRRFILCEACALTRYGMARPAIDASALARDGKAAALGNDE